MGEYPSFWDKLPKSTKCIFRIRGTNLQERWVSSSELPYKFVNNYVTFKVQREIPENIQKEIDEWLSVNKCYTEFDNSLFFPPTHLYFDSIWDKVDPKHNWLMVDPDFSVYSSEYEPSFDLNLFEWVPCPLEECVRYGHEEFIRIETLLRSHIMNCGIKPHERVFRRPIKNVVNNSLLESRDFYIEANCVITANETSKGNTMTKQIVSKNVEIAKQVALLESGRLVNKRLAKAIAKKYPIVKEYIDNPLGQMAISNLFLVAIQTYKPENEALITAAESAVAASYSELILSLNLEEIINEVFPQN